MTGRMQEILTCPICIELFRKPVLTLPCQHSLCKICVEQLWDNRNLQNRCPTCRQIFSQGLSSVDDLPRNYLVETMVEELGGTQRLATVQVATQENSNMNNKLDTKSLSQLASNLMKMKQYDEAKDVLSALNECSQGIEAIDVKINLMRCCIETEDNQKAKELTRSLFASLSKINIERRDAKIASCKLKEFAKELSMLNHPLKAVKFLESASEISDTIEDQVEKLEEQMTCLEIMQGVTKCMKRHDMKKEFQNVAFPIIYRIYCNFTRVQLIDKKQQCIKTAWCLKYIGFCCNEIGDYTKSLEYNNRAVIHLQKHLNEEAQFYRVLGVSYHNLAAAYKSLERYQNSEQAYLKAIEIYHSAKDWPNQERKNNSIILSAIGLSEAHIRKE